MHKPDVIPPDVRGRLTEFHLRWLATQKQELNTTFDEILENAFTEWLARHSKAKMNFQNATELQHFAIRWVRERE